MFILAVTCSGIGMLVVSFSKTLDNFAAIMNFVIFPSFLFYLGRFIRLPIYLMH